MNGREYRRPSLPALGEVLGADQDLAGLGAVARAAMLINSVLLHHVEFTFYGILFDIVTSSWRVEFYEDKTGCQVEEFLEALEKPKRAKVLAIIRMLEELGPTLPFPYSSRVEGKLRELRTHYGDELYRVLYYGAPGRVYVLLHAFVKRTKKTPRREIETATRRMKRSAEARSQKRRRR